MVLFLMLPIHQIQLAVRVVPLVLWPQVCQRPLRKLLLPLAMQIRHMVLFRNMPAIIHKMLLSQLRYHQLQLLVQLRMPMLVQLPAQLQMPKPLQRLLTVKLQPGMRPLVLPSSQLGAQQLVRLQD